MKKIISLFLLSLAVLVLSGCNLKTALVEKTAVKELSQDEAKNKSQDFIKNVLVTPGTDITFKDVTKENGLYKIPLTIKGKDKTPDQDITAYMSVDGKLFFPNAMDIAEVSKQAQDAKNNPQKDAAAQPAQQDIPKTDAPTVELFVMSHCPYGTQIEKGITPVLDTLGSKIKFSLKFVSYTMHGDEEATENLKQYCIQKNTPAKLLPYLKCLLKTPGATADSATCMTSGGINAGDVDTCVSAATAQFNIQKGGTDFAVNKADNDKYGVKGSPTLVINGVTDNSAGRDSASLLKSICSAFKTQPKECSAQLSSASPNPGFGEGTASGSAPAASCNTPAAGN